MLKHKNGANIIISLQYNYRFLQVFSKRKDLHSIWKPLLMETSLVAEVKDAETCFGKKSSAPLSEVLPWKSLISSSHAPLTPFICTTIGTEPKDGGEVG